MKYIFYLMFSKIGIILSGSGKLRLANAMTTFTKAKSELNVSIKHEMVMEKKKNEALEKARKEFEKRERVLTNEVKEHMNTRNMSLAYLKKIDDFLNIDNTNDADDDKTGDVTAPNNDAEKTV